MEFQRVDRSDPERIFMTVYQSYSTATVTNGQWVGWDIVTDKNGYAVTKIKGTIRGAVAGVAVQSIAPGEYGLIQAWGYKRDVKCTGGSGSVTSKLTIGRPMYFATSGFASARAYERTTVPLKTDYGKFPVGVVITALNTAAKNTSAATTAFYSVLIRCL
jgi:hypothetical protein